MDVKLILAQIINFGLLLWLLTKYLYKPIIEVLEKRRAEIEAGLQKSQELEEKLRDFEKEREKQLQEVRSEAQRLIKKARDDAEEIKKKILVEARHDASQQVQKATELARSREAKIFQDLQQEMVDLVIKASEKVIQEDLSDDKHHRLIGKILADLQKDKLASSTS